MRGGALYVIAACVLALAGAAGARGQDANVSVGGLDVTAHQPEPLRLVLDYQMAPPAQVTGLSGTIDGTALPEPEITRYPAEGQTSAILFLIDTSDPARRRVIEAVVRDVGAMIGRAELFHRLGLATFDSTLTMRAEIGTDRDALQRALAGVRATGQRTELFRRGVDAILALDGVEAARKALFLFSDGRAEDDPKAYPLSYMADAARTARVRVYGFCYTGVEPPPISCQNLSRLAEETGGAYVAASRTLTLPAAATSAPFAGIDNGGRAVFDLSPAAAAHIGGKRDLRLVTALSGGRSIIVAVPVILPHVPLLDRALQPRNLPWTVAAAVAFLAIVGLVVYAILFMLRQRLAAAARRRPVAYLEFLDGKATRYPMLGGALRIGRSSGNDLRLANNSVSGHHAEINRRRDGTFIITDLKSVNGVTVNEARVESTELCDGDEIDLGEVRFRFVVSPAAKPAPRVSQPEPGHVDEPSREP